MAGHPFSAAATTSVADPHDLHDHHRCDGGGGGDGDVYLLLPAQNEACDPLRLVEGAIERLREDVGALFEPPVIAALTTLRAQDLAADQRLRQKAKQANPACSVTALDRATRGTDPGPADERSTLDELVALARAQCQLHHDADRKAVAVIRLPGRREVWRVPSSGFEDWLRAAYWRACEAGVAEGTMKAALATLAAAGLNDGDEVAVHVRAARWQGGYVIDLCDEHWQAVLVTPSGWQVVAESPVLFTRTPSMRPLPMPARNGDVGLLWRHTNIPPERRVMVLAWLLDCFRPDTPFPVLELVGEQGSAKSTTRSVLRSLNRPEQGGLARPAQDGGGHLRRCRQQLGGELREPLEPDT